MTFLATQLLPSHESAIPQPINFLPTIKSIFICSINERKLPIISNIFGAFKLLTFKYLFIYEFFALIGIFFLSILINITDKIFNISSKHTFILKYTSFNLSKYLYLFLIRNISKTAIATIELIPFGVTITKKITARIFDANEPSYSIIKKTFNDTFSETTKANLIEDISFGGRIAVQTINIVKFTTAILRNNNLGWVEQRFYQMLLKS